MYSFDIKIFKRKKVQSDCEFNNNDLLTLELLLHFELISCYLNPYFPSSDSLDTHVYEALIRKSSLEIFLDGFNT
jgi:hypothetical protein